MKLIIDILEEDFEIMKHNVAVDNPLCPINQKDMVIKIANGIPLDDLRAEIDAIYKEDMECDGCSDMRMVLDIIDKYKAEGSDKE